MRRIMLGGLLLIAFTMTTGCIAVAATEHTGHDSDQAEVVAVGERAYVVNKKTGKVWEVDLASAEKLNAKPTATK